MNKTLYDANYDDLNDFLTKYTKQYTSNYHVEDLRHYYEEKNNKNMIKAVEEMRYKFTPPYKLKDLDNISKEYLDKLQDIGIKTNNQFLYTCKTESERKGLSIKTNIPLEEINKIAKLSDLTRIFAVKGTRAKLYYEAGIDTVEKISELDAKELRDTVIKYIEESGFDGIATLVKEAEFTVNFAKKLYKIAEF